MNKSNIPPGDALINLDRAVSLLSLTRDQHATLINSVASIREALDEYDDLKITMPDQEP
ncbi:MAG: hypothetical protein KJ050_10605 [Candidatus Omnitrophica bacterium]|nr:hypothetical protein [Candidatus Omnitrophota bacterium]